MKRLIVMIAVTAALALGVSVGAPAGVAQAASISPDAPMPINVLPSVVKGSTGGLTRADYVAKFMYKFMVSPEFYKIVKIKEAAKANPTTAPKLTAPQQAVLTDMKSKYTPPATVPKGLTKVVNGVSGLAAAMTSFQVGTMIGNGVTEVFGLDPNNNVCQEIANGASWIGLVTGKDCSAYQRAVEYADQINKDATAGLLFDQICLGGVCQQFKGYAAQSSTAKSLCFSRTGTNSNIQVTYKDTSGVSGTTPFNGSTSAAATVCGQQVPGSTSSSVITWATARFLASYTLSDGSSPSTPPVTSTGKAADGNPERTFKCVILGTNGTSYTASTATFKETDINYPAVKCADLPQDVFPSKVKITLEGGTTTQTLYEQDVTPEYQAGSTTYPECMDGSCILELLKDGESCFVTPGPCSDWFTDPDKTTKYTCKYGVKVVSLSECNVYKPTFKPDSKTKGDTLADPATGEILENPIRPGAGSAPSGVADPSQPRDCFPTGWAVFNPFEWVLKPVGCALEYAFVPRQVKIQTGIDDLNSRFTHTTPGKYIDAFGSMSIFDTVNFPSGCSGVSIDMSWIPFTDVGTFHFLPACQGDFFADWAPLFKAFMYGTLAIGGLFALSRLIGNIFGYGGLKGESE